MWLSIINLVHPNTYDSVLKYILLLVYTQFNPIKSQIITFLQHMPQTVNFFIKFHFNNYKLSTISSKLEIMNFYSHTPSNQPNFIFCNRGNIVEIYLSFHNWRITLFTQSGVFLRILLCFVYYYPETTSSLLYAQAPLTRHFQRHFNNFTSTSKTTKSALKCHKNTFVRRNVKFSESFLGA